VYVRKWHQGQGTARRTRSALPLKPEVLKVYKMFDCQPGDFDV